ncbi:MAG TPA: STAS domain-containing protein [Candidatus Binatia bacterium]|nr:STAS domain-containing protein [Candidatus Binatia bacterium]
MLRITCIAEDEESATLKLEGWLIGPWVEELRNECESYVARRHTVILDLSDVRFVAPQGIRTLKALSRHCVLFVGMSTFLSALLADAEEKE